MYQKDTIAAIATPMGEGALAMIRMSGTDAIRIVSELFYRGPVSREKVDGNLAPNHAYFGRLIHKGEVLDEVVLTTFRSPKSYTCEDMAEICCHGSTFVAGLILTATIQYGARLAEPGEFTRRAFLNGRIDLTQAEAVADLIAAKSELWAKAALRQLQGTLGERVTKLRLDLVNCLAVIEAGMDFPEEDFAAQIQDQTIAIVKKTCLTLSDLLKSYEQAARMRQGYRTVIIGQPNVGKSSLLNALLAWDRAIVTPVPGTTRDTVEEWTDIDGICVRLIDTAGFRRSEDMVELAGIARTERACEDADIIILVVEAGRLLTQEEEILLERYKDKNLVIGVNKIDAPVGRETTKSSHQPICSFSAKTGDGLEMLKKTISSVARGGIAQSLSMDFMVNSRHNAALCKSYSILQELLTHIEHDDIEADIIANNLRIAANTLGEVIGVIASDDVLDSVFSRFCIGK